MRAGQSLAPEWLVLRARRPNVLLTGAHATTEVVMATLREYLIAPICYWAPNVTLPAPRDVATLLVCEVASLSLDQQQILLSWLDQVEPGETQVVSITALELFPLVERGSFLEALYYRLNILRLDAPTKIN